MNKDQKLLEEAYQSIYESVKVLLYFGPENGKQGWLKWLKRLDYKVHEDGSVSVIQDIIMWNQELTTRLPFNFKKVDGYFTCETNKLTTLEGAPAIVGGDFSCSYNELTSLQGAPKEVGGDFECSGNKLTSLEGAPEVIKGRFVSDQFSDEDYRAFVKKRKYVDGKLDKELDVDLDDFS